MNESRKVKEGRPEGTGSNEVMFLYPSSSSGESVVSVPLEMTWRTKGHTKVTEQDDRGWGSSRGVFRIFELLDPSLGVFADDQA